MRINERKQLANVRVSGVTLVPVVNVVDLTAVNSDIPIKTEDQNEKKGRNDHSLQVSRCVVKPRTMRIVRATSRLCSFHIK